MHGWRRTKHPGRPILQGAYGHPVHPLLVTVPLGTWSASLVFDVASHAGTCAAALTVGSAWLIAIGTVVAPPAAVIGTVLAVPWHRAHRRGRPRPRAGGSPAWAYPRLVERGHGVLAWVTTAPAFAVAVIG